MWLAARAQVEPTPTLTHTPTVTPSRSETPTPTPTITLTPTATQNFDVPPADGEVNAKDLFWILRNIKSGSEEVLFDFSRYWMEPIGENLP